MRTQGKYKYWLSFLELGVQLGRIYKQSQHRHMIRVWRAYCRREEKGTVRGYQQGSGLPRLLGYQSSLGGSLGAELSRRADIY